jgi:class 3 adenylate cyclase
MFAASSAEQGLAGARSLQAITSSHLSIEAVRIGLSSGEAITRAGDLFGTVVNEASRLVSAAEPGEILVSASTADGGAQPGIGEAFELDAKGFSEPILAHRLLD